jgi:acyl carrier protein
MASLLDDLQDVFRGVFADDELQIAESTTAPDVDGWDSLVHINLIIAIEKRFGVRFATAEISRLNTSGANVGTLLDLLRRKIGSQGT